MQRAQYMQTHPAATALHTATDKQQNLTIVQTAARHAARHSTDRWLYESRQVSLKDRCILACISLNKAAWGQVVLKYICVLVCCYKRLDAYANAACQGVCINVETLLKSFLSIYFIIYLSLYFSYHSAIRI